LQSSCVTAGSTTFVNENLTVIQQAKKVEREIHLSTGPEVQEGQESFNPTLPSTSELEVGGRVMPCPGHFTLGEETRCPLFRALSVSMGRS
jgi:hypothetical protein